MKKKVQLHRLFYPIIAGLVIGILAMLVTVRLATAAPLVQEEQPSPHLEGQTCRDCHLDVDESWSQSAHAHAYDDVNFQERWKAIGEKGDCLLCHTTNYQATSGTYDAEGVACEACHGKVDANHPPAAVPIRADTEYCGTCHTTTLGEWRLTGHAGADVGCTDCHNPHSQEALFENPDEMCINCHKDGMSGYLEDTHSQKGIGCVDCHALVIPPEEPPQDGIVPTGHSFTITPATCVACHTDALHSGFSLPGYESGAKAAALAQGDTQEVHPVVQAAGGVSPEQKIQVLENQIQAYQANLASRNMTIVFQGGVVGLVLGGTTAWVVASNVRRRKEDEEHHDIQED